MKILDAADTRSALDFERLVPALHAAFAEGMTVPARHVHQIEVDGRRGTVLVMPAWSEAGFLGIKTINIYPSNAQEGLPGLHATYLLYDARTGVPLASMDGNEITSRRTAAAAALGASFLARKDARRLLVLGAGRVARCLPAAFASVRPIERVEVWNHRPSGAAAMAAELRSDDWKAEAVTDLEAAVRNADIVSCATLATEPLVQGTWLGAGSHLDLIGSFTPQMKEASPDCFAQARTFVDTDEALQKSGDLLDAMAAGSLRRDGIAGTLAELCRGARPGRVAEGERTVFKAVGTALEDLAAATLVWQANAGPRS
ncbi:Ornithine cyclodeaminase [Burkholderiales bacterium 8X]|nr:Ornithine cyclodeaminase [Burkholderiales bacterium 8X]